MSELGNFLDKQLAVQGITGEEMAGNMGISRTHFSAFKTSRNKSMNVATLMMMSTGISDDPAVQAGLLQAYFRDQVGEGFRDWVRVAPGTPSAALMEDTPAYGARGPVEELAALLRSLHLSNDVVRALIDIARYIPGHHKFRAVIEDLGKFAAEELLPGKSAGRGKSAAAAPHVAGPAHPKHQETPKTTPEKGQPHPKSTQGIRAASRKPPHDSTQKP